MNDTVRVRLVPKSRDGQSITVNLAEITPATAKRFSPDPERASYAEHAALNLGMEATITAHSSIDAVVPNERFHSIFGSAPGDTTQEVPVPHELSDTIAFAYVPNAVDFFSSFVPPTVAVDHLRLSDVSSAIRTASCHTKDWTGKGIRIAMTDTGFAPHPHFDRCGYQFLRVPTPLVSNPKIDTDGHGTGECANALVAAPSSVLIGVKHDDYSALALETALEHHPHVIVNSWGWSIDNQSKANLRATNPNQFNELRDIESIVADAIDDGVVVVFAGGNGHLAFPASIPDVLAVGGVTVRPDGSIEASDYASSFRSQLYPARTVPDLCGVVGDRAGTGHIMLPVPVGSRLDGHNIGHVPSNGWGIFSGTSAAAPQVAGVVALLKSIAPRLTPNQVRAILQSTATDVTQGVSGHGDQAGVGFDHATGAGLVDALRACALAESMTER